jgi:hypothetical protein
VSKVLVRFLEYRSFLEYLTILKEDELGLKKWDEVRAVLRNICPSLWVTRFSRRMNATDTLGYRTLPSCQSIRGVLSFPCGLRYSRSMMSADDAHDACYH